MTQTITDASQIKNVNESIIQLTAGENITAWDAVQLTQDFSESQSISSSNANLFSTNYGQTIDVSDIDILETYEVFWLTSNSITRSPVLEIYDDDTKATLLWSYTYTVSSNPWASGTYTIDMNLDVSNYTSLYVYYEDWASQPFWDRINLRYQSTDVYAGWTRYVNGVAQTWDMAFSIVWRRSDGSAYKTDATSKNKLEFIGYAREDALEGEIVPVATSGKNKNQTGLDVWKNYFLSNIPWEISLNPWLNYVQVGKAISDTEITIHNFQEEQTNRIVASDNAKAISLEEEFVKVFDVPSSTPYHNVKNFTLLTTPEWGSMRITWEARIDNATDIDLWYNINNTSGWNVLILNLDGLWTSYIPFTVDIPFVANMDNVRLWFQSTSPNWITCFLRNVEVKYDYVTTWKWAVFN